MDPQQPDASQQPGAAPPSSGVAGWRAPDAPAPPGQPGETAPPQWQPPGTGTYVPRRARPGSITAAAIVLIVLGVLVGLLGLLFVLVGATFGSIISMPELQDQLGNISEAAGGVFVVFGLLFLADGVLQVLSGIFLLPGRQWARIAGLVAGVLGVLVALVNVLPAETGGGGLNLFFLVLLAGYVYVVWVLATTGAWFRR